MNTRSLLVRLPAAITLAFALTAAQVGAQVTTFTDATNDIASGIATAGGTLDIVKMEVVDTETDVIFTMTLNGNTSTGGNDWGNFMIGIANQKTPGTTTGNGWNRPINLNAGVTNSVTNGMTHWIGSWVRGGGGSQLWTYGTTNWSGPAAAAGFAVSAGAQSTITYTVSKASLGVTNGDTIIFDAYSSGGGVGDSAVDALSNPGNSISGWGGPYTSSATNVTPTVGTGQTRSYKLANTASPITNTVTFSVDMSAQISIGAFNPDFDTVSVAGSFNGFNPSANSLSAIGGGIYQATIPVVAGSGTIVDYRYVIDSGLFEAENLNRTFPVGANPAPAPLVIPTVFFNNIAGYRDVTFSVDMAAAQTAGAFNPATQTVQVRGPFNSWAGTTLSNTGGTLYGATVRMSGTTNNQPTSYKYYVAATPQSQAVGYESGADRSFNLVFNGNLNPQPALTLAQDTFNTPEFRPVTFQVDMTVLEAAGGFTPGVDSVRAYGSFSDWATGGAAYQLTNSSTNGVYSGTFIVPGTNGGSISYKFFNTRAGAPNGGFESGSNRTATLGASGTTPQVLPLVFWNNNSGQTRDVTFRVDMSVQVALGLFNPSETNPAVGGIVQVRGIDGNFNAGPVLAREGTSLIYSGTFSVAGTAGTDFGYKFWSPGINFYNVPDNTGFEQINLTDQFQNRVITLGPNGAAMNLPVSFFSNQLFYIVGSAPTPFSTTLGTASAAQSVTINGQGLTANIVANAPTGFEVSADGINYGTTANIAPTAGALTASNNLFVRISASAGAGSPAGNVTLTSTGGQPLSIAVSGTVSNPSSIVTASDTAANYAGGWTNGANGGSGFGAWNISSFNGTNTNTPGFAGAFIGDPAAAGITNFGSQAFGLYANPNGSGAFVNAGRTFPLLQVGQTFSFKWAVNWDSEGGNKGFNIFGGGQQLVNVNQGGSPGDIVVNAGTNSFNTSNSITYGTNPMTWSFTRTAADNLLVTSTGRDGTTNIAFSTNVAIITGPDAVTWYAADMAAGDQRQPFFNNLQVSGPTLVTNQVTFSVDMSAQVTAGTFNPQTGVVEVRGEFNGFAGGSVLTSQGNGIYSGTFAISGTTGTPVFYKFWATGLDYEAGSNRSFTIGTAGQVQDLQTVPFISGLPPQTRNVNFTVDMSVQISLGTFNPATGVVEVRGPFNGWNGTALTAQGAGIYGGTVSVPGAAGGTEQYKFWATGLQWEIIDGNPDANRTFVLGTSGALQILPTVFFSNQTSAGQTFAGWSGGLSNTPSLQLKYAIGGASSPSATNGVAPVTTMSSNTLSITAVVRTNDPSLTVAGQTLVNLATGSWSTNEVTITPQADPAPEGCQVQTFSTPRGTEGKKFLRLQTLLTNQ